MENHPQQNNHPTEIPPPPAPPVNQAEGYQPIGDYYQQGRSKLVDFLYGFFGIVLVYGAAVLLSMVAGMFGAMLFGLGFIANVAAIIIFFMRRRRFIAIGALVLLLVLFSIPLLLLGACLLQGFPGF